MEEMDPLARSNTFSYSEIEINPYEVLNLDENKQDTNQFLQQSKSNFRNLISNEKMPYYQRRKIALARQILMKPKEYKRVNGKFVYKYIENIFHDAIQCDFKKLVPQLQQEIEQKLEVKDERDQGLLYLATQPGYKIMILYLLQKGININQTQSTGSTPLHIACFNGHVSCIDILLLNGADMNIKNNFGNLPLEEAYAPKQNKINDLFNKYEFLRNNNKIYQQIHDLRQKQLISLAYTMYNAEGEDVGIFIQPNYNNNPKQKQKLIYAMNNPRYVNTVYHGTKLQYLEAILKNGLLTPKERGQDKLESCKIQLGSTVRNVKDWANAIFVTKSPYYASQKIYTDYFEVQNIINQEKVDQNYFLILQCAVQQNDIGQENVYTSWKHTMGSYDLVPGEPELVEYRVTDSTKILVTGIYFFNKDYLKKINDCQLSMELLNEKGKIDGIYTDNNNTHKVSIKYWELCLMGHRLEQKADNAYECDVCGIKEKSCYHCGKCLFTRCQKCYKARKLL
ncbi:Ankyrin repeat-containing domain [Pseudocohnilembus persalinus]|uniref:Ankyrin repeat-containing domain n=1 Tax=Pseudocohnilembus persalinus TaxID=266149 RepID=A0A0V0QLK3_PSEPJ|nr:Ankyrin repeat-containing domain [Pseudocohnilembus persalinus]|eukprot:KRX03122.1 Ankyrin repeat-containing domain [Pseudocohnilembus persalinus]